MVDRSTAPKRRDWARLAAGFLVGTALSLAFGGGEGWPTRALMAATTGIVGVLLAHVLTGKSRGGRRGPDP
jgi:hypothetical protein